MSSLRASLTAAVIALTLSASAAAQQPAAADPVPPPAAAAPAAAAPAASAPNTSVPATGTPLHLRSSGGSASEAPSPTGSLWKLGAISAIIAAAAWYLRKKRGALGPNAAPPKTIQVLSRASVGVRTELVVVEVDGMTLLLGVTPSAVSRLAVLGADAPAVAKDEATEATEENTEADESAEASKESMVGVERLRDALGGTERFARLLEGVKKSSPAPRLVVKGEPMPVEPQARGLLALRKR